MNTLLNRMTQIRTEIAAADAPSHEGPTWKTPSWAIRSDLVDGDLHKAVAAALETEETLWDGPADSHTYRKPLGREVTWDDVSAEMARVDALPAEEHVLERWCGCQVSVMRYPAVLKKWYGHKVIVACGMEAIGHHNALTALRDFHRSVESISEPLS